MTQQVRLREDKKLFEDKPKWLRKKTKPPNPFAYQ